MSDWASAAQEVPRTGEPTMLLSNGEKSGERGEVEHLVTLQEQRVGKMHDDVSDASQIRIMFVNERLSLSSCVRQLASHLCSNMMIW